MKDESVAAAEVVCVCGGDSVAGIQAARSDRKRRVKRSFFISLLITKETKGH